jgi:DNA repair protein RadC
MVPRSTHDDLLAQSADALSDRDLIQLVTGEASHGAAGSPFELAAMSLTELEALGLSRKGAQRLRASFELARRSRVAQPLPATVRVPEDAYACLAPLIDDAEREHFAIIVLDVRNRPRRVARVAQGSVDRCHVDPRDVFAPAIREHGTAVVVAHNHPSGDPTPSPEDIALTRRLVQAGALLGLPVLDHLIIASGPYVRENRPFVSLAEAGVMVAGIAPSESVAKAPRRYVIRAKAERNVRRVGIATRRRR